jgi:uncharacterized protein (DUF2141 family)
MAFCLAWLLVPVAAQGQSKPGMGSLVVDVEGFTTSEGMAGIALFDQQSNYEAKNPVYHWAWAVIMENKAGCVIAQLPYGEYAVTVFHDANSNQRMDMMLGLPQEPYGFSNNPFHGMGAPPWSKVRVMLNQPIKRIVVKVSGGHYAK